MAKSKVTIGDVSKFRKKLSLIPEHSKKFVALTMTGLIIAGAAYGCDANKEVTPVETTSISAEQNSTEQQQDIDFSKITVVFENNGEVSKDITKLAVLKLEEVGVKTYVADDDCLDSVKEALTENPTDDILVIRVGGEKNETGQTVIMANYNDGLYGESGLKNSDSLALAISLQSRDLKKVVSGKTVVGTEMTTRGPTKLETNLATINPGNRGLRNVTVAIYNNDTYTQDISYAIINGVVNYAGLSETQRGYSYYRMAGTVRMSECAGKYWSDIVQVNESPNLDKNINDYIKTVNNVSY